MHAAAMGHDTLIWAREPEVVETINDPAVKENVTYLKVCYLSFLQCLQGIRLPAKSRVVASHIRSKQR